MRSSHQACFDLFQNLSLFCLFSVCFVKDLSQYVCVILCPHSLTGVVWCVRVYLCGGVGGGGGGGGGGGAGICG